MTIFWPSVLKTQRCSSELRNATRSGGPSLSGHEQRIVGPGARWEFTYSNFVIRKKDEVDAFRAIIARLRQGEDIVIEICDRYRPANFATATAEMTAVADLRATSLSLSGPGVRLSAGQHLSLGERFYRIEQITAAGTTNIGLVRSITELDVWDDAAIWIDDPEEGGTYTLKITPPLREATTIRQVVNFDVLKCLCVVKDINDGDLDLEMGRWAFPSITFQEEL